MRFPAGLWEQMGILRDEFEATLDSLPVLETYNQKIAAFDLSIIVNDQSDLQFHVGRGLLDHWKNAVATNGSLPNELIEALTAEVNKLLTIAELMTNRFQRDDFTFTVSLNLCLTQRTIDADADILPGYVGFYFMCGICQETGTMQLINYYGGSQVCYGPC